MPNVQTYESTAKVIFARTMEIEGQLNATERGLITEAIRTAPKKPLPARQLGIPIARRERERFVLRKKNRRATVARQPPRGATASVQAKVPAGGNRRLVFAVFSLRLCVAAAAKKIFQAIVRWRLKI
jgi:hypothetical protein